MSDPKYGYLIIMAASDGGYIVTQNDGGGRYPGPLFAGSLVDALAYIGRQMKRGEDEPAPVIVEKR